MTSHFNTVKTQKLFSIEVPTTTTYLQHENKQCSLIQVMMKQKTTLNVIFYTIPPNLWPRVVTFTAKYGPTEMYRYKIILIHTKV